MNRTRVGVLALVTIVVIATAGVWLGAQTKTATETFGPIAASPAYIVVNRATHVTFTAQITDRQLKKRSVILVRLDSTGPPYEIVGRLRDDGKNNDLKANDSIYSLRTSLNETIIGTANFKVAARFKAGKWVEPEADDDDWDVELTSAPTTGRDQPAERTKREKRLKKLARYVLSNPVIVTVDPFTLPPDPGEAGKQTLEGIDSDRDGVRDDAQRWIGVTYASKPQLFNAATQFVQVQLDFVTQASGRSVVEIVEQRHRAQGCLNYRLGSPYNTSLFIDESKQIILNTRARSDAYLAANRQLGGLSFPGTGPLDWAQGCN